MFILVFGSVPSRPVPPVTNLRIELCASRQLKMSELPVTNLHIPAYSRAGRADALPALALFSLVHLHSDLIVTFQSIHIKQC